LPALRHSNAPHEKYIATRCRPALRIAAGPRCMQHGPSVRSIANFPIRDFSSMLRINAAIRNFSDEMERQTLHHDARVRPRANPALVRGGA
jgi:hypothetical protein